MTETGIRCTNAQALQERLIIWEGLSLVSRAEGDSVSAPYDDVPLIVPRGLGRPATLDETHEIAATPDTKRVLQLCRLPRDVGDLLMRRCREAPPLGQQLAERSTGEFMNVREDLPGQLTVTTRVGDIPTPVPIKVGYHIDTWQNEDIDLTIINGGPGPRWHCIVPGYTRSEVGGAGRQDRIDYFRQHSGIVAKVYGIRLDPPDEYYEAITGSPAAHLLHDGSTIYADEPSTAAFIFSSNPDATYQQRMEAIQ